MKNLFYFITLLLSVFFITSCSDDDSNSTPETVTKDNYEVYGLVNAKASMEGGDLVITKLDESLSDFSFNLRPLTEQYWFNVYYTNLLISGSKKVKTIVNTKDKFTGEKFTGRGSTFTLDNIQFHNSNDNIYSQKLFGIGPNGNWNEPDIDTIVGPQSIWPIIIGGAWAAKYILDHYSYERKTNYDADGNVTSSHTEHNWGGMAPPTDDGNGNIGIVMGDINEYGFELYNNLLNDIPIESPNPNEPNQVAPVVIDGVEYTCTDINRIRISGIFNGRKP